MHVTRISGIPCSVEFEYSPAVEWRQHRFAGAGPGDCDPPECEEFEITQVFDRKGYPAEWLAKKLTRDDELRILEELKNGE